VAVLGCQAGAGSRASFQLSPAAQTCCGCGNPAHIRRRKFHGHYLQMFDHTEKVLRVGFPGNHFPSHFPSHPSPQP